MNILPYVKKIQYTGGTLNLQSIKPYCGDVDKRIRKAIDKLPCSSGGAVLELNIGNDDSEKYTVEIKEYKASVKKSLWVPPKEDS